MTMKDGFEILWSMAKVLIPGLIILGIIELVITYITRAKEKVINKINTDISNKKIEKHICPKCGGTLVEKDGKYGTFIGCSNYPNCKFTKKL